MAKYKIFANIDYIMGHLRYGHYEGVLNEEDLPDNWKEKITKDPSFIKKLDLNLIVDDYEVDGVGNICDIEIEEIEED